MLEILASVWRWRKLVKELALRDLRSRYAGSALGGAWAILEPLVQFVLYFTVFSYFLGMRLEGRPGMSSFALYLVSGLVPFQMFQECLGRATTLARSQAGLVRHVSVPLEVLLAGALLGIVLRHLFMLGLVAIAAIAVGTITWTALPITLAGLLVLAVGTLGLALALVPAGAFLPDLAHIVGTGTTVLFFLTPIVYPLSAVPLPARPFMMLNPFFGVIEAIRAGVVGGPAAPGRLALAAAVSAACLLGGALVYQARGRAVRDLV